MIRVAKTFTLVLATLAFTLGYIASASGETYYRWNDERGNPVHSDRPPDTGIDYEVISTGSSLKRVVDAEEGAVPPEITTRAGNEFEEVDPKTQAQVQKKNPEYCQRAKDNLNALNTSARIRVRDAQGEFRFLNEEEKTARRQEAEEAIATHCE